MSVVPRLLAAALSFAAVAASLVLATSVPAQAESTTPAWGPSVAVIGGTLTSRYTDEPGSPSQGWWSIAAHIVGATSVSLSAEGGSSITAAGNKCQGTTYGRRLRYLKKVDILIVEVSTDSHKICTSQGLRKLSAEQNRRHIRRYVNQLVARVDVLGIPHNRVFFVSPRATTSSRRDAFIRRHLKTYVGPKHAGFSFITTPALKSREVFHSIQPNAAGNRVIGRAIAAAVARKALASRAPAPVPGPGPSVMVVGDSITSWYSDEDGSPSQGWWSILARNLGASSIRTSAEGGSGVNVRGNGCRGTTFGERLGAIRRVDILIVEVGRNDYKKCADDPSYRPGPSDPQSLGIESYTRALSARVAELGMSPRQVWFVTPWGTRDPSWIEPVQLAVRTAATAQEAGFGFIQTPLLTDPYTIDGVHPNRAGNDVLAWAVQTAIQAPR